MGSVAPSFVFYARGGEEMWLFGGLALAENFELACRQESDY
jgi:hypothetical protein